MSQQSVNSKANSSSNERGSSMNPFPFSAAIWQLPRQYIKVLCKPSVQSFREEMGKASWGMVLFQLYVLIMITVILSYVAHLIPSSALHTTSAFSLGSFKPFAFLPSPFNGMTFILGSFFIGLATAYVFSKFWQGQGSFVVHTYSLLLCTVPLVTISGALLLLPTPGSLVILLISLLVIVFVYRMVLHAFLIMGVHGLNTAKATLIVLIIPMFIVGLAMLGLIILLIITGGEFLGGILESIDWFPGQRWKRNKGES